MKQWIIGGVLAVVLGVAGVVGYNVVYSDDYQEQPGVVYNNDGDGHDHDHGYFGVE